jgi:Superinfection immunity protein
MMTDFATLGFSNWATSMVISIGIAVLASALLTIWAGRRFGLSSHNNLWVFIVAVALLAGTFTSASTASNVGLNRQFDAFLLPAILMLAYFLPTAMAIAADNKSFGAIFILNLFFGWTVMAWFVALVWAVSPARADRRAAYRITPFGAVPDEPPVGSRKPA